MADEEVQGISEEEEVARDGAAEQAAQAKEPELDPTPAKEPAPAPVLPAGKLVAYQLDKKLSQVAHVLGVAADGGVTLLLMDTAGLRQEIGGVRYDASGAIGTWHEAA